MSLAPRAVLVHRHTELEELVARHGTRGQAAFYLRTRGRRIEDLEARHAGQAAAMVAVSSAIPADWRRGMVERADLPRFLFGPDDIVVAVGQDGLVANLAKYLDGQLIVGIDPEPGRNPAVLVRHPSGACAGGCSALRRSPRAAGAEAEAMARPKAAAAPSSAWPLDHRRNRRWAAAHRAERDLRRPAHAPDRPLHAPTAGRPGGGAGIFGAHRVHWHRRDGLVPLGLGWSAASCPLAHLPGPEEDRLVWFVREAWPSPATGTDCTEGTLSAGQEIEVTAESDRLVLFGDGIEADTVPLTWGQSARLRLADHSLRLL